MNFFPLKPQPEHGPPSAGCSKWDPVIRNEALTSSFPKTGATKRKFWGDNSKAGKESESLEWNKDQETAKKANLEI